MAIEPRAGPSCSSDPMWPTRPWPYGSTPVTAPWARTGPGYGENVDAPRASHPDGDAVIVDGFRVEPLTVDRFDDFIEVVGNSGIGGCWCMYWTCATSAEWGEGCKGGSKAPNPTGVPRSGRSRTTPRTADLPRRYSGRVVPSHAPKGIAWPAELPLLQDRSRHRRRVVGRLFRGEEAPPRSRPHHGHDQSSHRVRSRTRRLDRGGLPLDTTETKAESVIYTGKASTFRRLAFEVVQRRADHKPMMRITINDNDRERPTH